MHLELTPTFTSMNVQVPSLLLPALRGSGETMSLITALSLLTLGHRRKASKSWYFELKCSWGEAGYSLSFFTYSLLVIQDHGL